jgi:hypothetical protein
VTTYFTAVSNDLLPDLRQPDPQRMPAGLRLKREVGPIVSPHGGMTLVEFEDDGAPADLAGRTVTPVMLAHYDEGGAQTYVSVVRRDLDMTRYQIA